MEWAVVSDREWRTQQETPEPEVEQPWIFDDGGRGMNRTTGDCTVRAAAIALELPYDEVREDLHRIQDYILVERARSRGLRTPSNRQTDPRFGGNWSAISQFLFNHGWTYEKAYPTGNRKTARSVARDMPKEDRLIIAQRNHVVAMLHGKIHDEHDSRRKQAYGYWRLTKDGEEPVMGPSQGYGPKNYRNGDALHWRWSG